MRCFECGCEVPEKTGVVRMTRKDGSMIIFKGIPITECRQCGEQCIPGHWVEKIGELMRKEELLTSEEVVSIPIINLCQEART